MVESPHFKVIYRDNHAHLASHVLNSAEKALERLSAIFNYIPDEKIVIATYDASDYGFASATSVPLNFIRLEIEPMEPGYESVPYNERLQWLISHELVHIVVNDHSSDYEKAARTLFAKVAPEQPQPLTIFFSLLTNYGRYTPRWHQEAIAVYLETWLSGGFGRTLGNFDEMYFRSMVLENKDFPTELELETKLTHNSFILETLYYIYGARFSTYLAVEYGPDKLLSWFRTDEKDFYPGFIRKFEIIFGIDFCSAWENFIANEKRFQQENLDRLRASVASPVIRLTHKAIGTISHAHYDKQSKSMLFAFHSPHRLAGIQRFKLDSSASDELISMPTPSILQVASTAYDDSLNYFFYTTNNNQLYRDIWLLDLKANKNRILFKDFRIGHLTISSSTHDLWGIQHFGGKAALVYSPFPYNKIVPLIGFSIGDEIQQLSISPSGRLLAATLHRINGNQQIIIANSEGLKEGEPFRYEVITTAGSPENPSWSSDEKILFWNAYTNGVSNIYRMDLEAKQILPISNTLSGLFKPVFLNRDSLFAFEFTSDGFQPVIIPNTPAGRLPAIEYLGQKIIDKNPELMNWALDSSSESITETAVKNAEKYNGLLNLKIQTFIPVITGFQIQKVLGIYTHIADPLFNHDLTIETGYSPFKEQPQGPKFHFKGKYVYDGGLEIGVDYNATDFYDLFNERKRGMIGSKFRVGYRHFWIYDNPHKLKQLAEIALYTDVEYINDNKVRVSQPDFMVAQSSLNSQALRRSIGSSDYEKGDEFNLSIMAFGSNPDDPVYAAQVYGEWDNFSTWLIPHNVFHFKLAAGYHEKNDKLYQARFFFGGFGNRELENVDVKQFRKVFRFPGIPIYSLAAERFLKVMVENNLPPWRFSSLSIGHHFLNHIDASVYAQGLLVKSPQGSRWLSIGGQLNLIIKHWYNLESTFSAGAARAWYEGGNKTDWFFSFKLLKN